jgi:hypothetical protein
MPREQENRSLNNAGDRMPDQLGEPEEVARFLRKTEKTLANWRSLNIGPRYYKIHGHILYDWADVRAWLASQQVDPRLIGA